MAIDEGETIILTARFEDDSGNLTNPSTPVEVTVRHRDSNSADGPFTATQVSTGVFKYEYTASKEGGYHYKFTSADGAVEQGDFTAKEDATNP